MSRTPPVVSPVDGEPLRDLDAFVAGLLRERDEARAQRDVLLAALKALLEDDAINLWMGGNPNHINRVVQQGCDAIAQATR